MENACSAHETACWDVLAGADEDTVVTMVGAAVPQKPGDRTIYGTGDAASPVCAVLTR